MKRSLSSKVLWLGLAGIVMAACGVAFLGAGGAQARTVMHGIDNLPWVFVLCGEAGSPEMIYQEPADNVPWLMIKVNAPGKCR